MIPPILTSSTLYNITQTTQAQVGIETSLKAIGRPGFILLDKSIDKNTKKYSSMKEFLYQLTCFTASMLVIIPVFKKGIKPTLVKTGLKAYFGPDECLFLLNRSSGPKKGFILANSIGLVDSDYYGNPDNDGHLMYAFFNAGEEDIQVKKGDVIGQAVFSTFLVTDTDKSTGKRTGGFGSTDKV